MERTVKVILNGKEVYGLPDQKILDLCTECGIEIPTLCYDPHLSVHGGCSVCLVEVKGAKSLVRACSATISNGMEINTRSARAVNARKLALELLLSDHVGDCRPPCTLTCPANGNVQAYINLAAQGKYKESLDILHEHVTLPASIGRVCPAPCQEKCRRNFVDEEPVSIREIKRFVGDVALEKGFLGTIPSIKENGKSVAVVGGGPAGVSAAYYLRLKGYQVTLIDKEPLLGGMMRYGIPDYRLPQNVLQSEIDWLLGHGVTVRTNTCLGRDVTLDELRNDNDAVLLAMGCWSSSPMRAEGEDLPGVLGGIDFLYTVNSGNPAVLGKKVVVIGGGNTAMDACRCAKRLGAEEVSVIYRRTRAEMPAEDIEIEEAMEEGINFIFLASPTKVEGKGKVERIICEKMELGEPDASGRRRPVATGETFAMDVDNVIAAIGQKTDFTGLPGSIHDGRKMIVNEDYATPLPGVFVCGDQQTGPKIAIEAIGNGHWAVDSIHHYLTHGYAKKPFYFDVTREDLGPEDFTDREKQPREQPAHVQAEIRMSKPFEEYNAGLTEEQVLRDASRCLECGCEDVFECKLRKYAIDYEVDPSRVAGEHISKEEYANEYYVRNMDKCILCGRCVRACDEIAGFHAIDFAKRGFESVMAPQFFVPIEDSDCTFCGLCTQVCPVGALVEKRAPRWPHTEKPEIVKTTCNKCPVGCELDLNLDNARERIVRITTDLDNPASPTYGNCCVKGRYSFGDVSKDRIISPLHNGTEVAWKDVIADIAQITENTGKDSTAFLTSASLTNEEMKALKVLTGEVLQDIPVTVKDFDIFRPCIEALNEKWGIHGSTAGYDQILSADCILLIDSDTDEEQPVLSSWIRRAMRKNFTQIIYLGKDPGILGKGDSMVLSPKQGTEEDLLKGILAEVTRKTEGHVQDMLKLYTLEYTESLTGISSTEIARCVKLLLESKDLVTMWGSKVAACSSRTGNVLDLMEKLDKKSFFLLYREANMQGAINIDLSSLSIMELLERVRNGQIKNLFAVDIDPLSAGFTKEDLQKLNNLVILNSNRFDSCELAEFVLPLTSWAEKNGTFTNLCGRQVEIMAGPLTTGEARDLAWVISNTARTAGRELHANPLSY